MLNWISKLPKDKILHFLVGIIICGVLQKFIPIWWAFSITSIIGILKEVWDSKQPNHTADVVDAVVTSLGALFIVVVV